MNRGSKVPLVGHAIPEWLQQMGVLKEIVIRVVDGSLTQESCIHLARKRRTIARYYLLMAKRTRNPVVALNCLKRAEALGPPDEATLKETIEILKRHRLWSYGETRIQELLSSAPCDHFAHRQMSEILFRAGRGPEALPFARRASMLLPSEPLYQVHLAEVLLSQHILEEAAAVAKSVTVTHPTLAIGWRVLSRVLWAAGDRGTSLIAAYEANKLEASPYGLYTYANYLAQLGSYSEAVEVLGRAIKSGMESADIHSELAQYLLRLGRTDEALIVLKSALQCYPSNHSLRTGMKEALTQDLKAAT